MFYNYGFPLDQKTLTAKNACMQLDDLIVLMIRDELLIKAADLFHRLFRRGIDSFKAPHNMGSYIPAGYLTRRKRRKRKEKKKEKRKRKRESKQANKRAPIWMEKGFRNCFCSKP